MNANNFVAVVSGDLVKSTRLEAQRSAVIKGVKNAVGATRARLAKKNAGYCFRTFIEEMPSN